MKRCLRSEKLLTSGGGPWARYQSACTFAQKSCWKSHKNKSHVKIVANGTVTEMLALAFLPACLPSCRKKVFLFTRNISLRRNFNGQTSLNLISRNCSRSRFSSFFLWNGKTWKRDFLFSPLKQVNSKISVNLKLFFSKMLHLKLRINSFHAFCLFRNLTLRNCAFFGI